jgi:hypothetical protein
VKQIVGWEKLYIEEIKNFNSSPDIFRMKADNLDETCIKHGGD